ncbi:MAG: hypothetical protein V8R91_22020 [Butyricimonas faecihominis]
MRENIRALGVLMKREVRMLAERRIYWFVMIFAPLFCFLFFMDLLKEGLPKKLPVAGRWMRIIPRLPVLWCVR